MDLLWGQGPPSRSTRDVTAFAFVTAQFPKLDLYNVRNVVKSVPRPVSAQDFQKFVELIRRLFWPMKDAKTIFFIAVIVAATGAVSPPMALMGGIVFGLCFTHRYRAESKDLPKLLLHSSVLPL